jgi:hypothetical protein
MGEIVAYILGIVAASLCLFVGGLFLRHRASTGLRLIRLGAILEIIGVLVIAGVTIYTFPTGFTGLDWWSIIGNRILSAIGDLPVPILLIVLASRREVKEYIVQ